jgi:hypothetical protein
MFSHSLRRFSNRKPFSERHTLRKPKSRVSDATMRQSTSQDHRTRCSARISAVTHVPRSDSFRRSQMKYVWISAALVCFASINSADAGLFSHRGCGCAPAPSCCAPAPTCAAPAACAPSCAAPAACAPSCAAPVACAPACNTGCGGCHKSCFKLPKLCMPKIRCCKVRNRCCRPACGTGCAPTCAAPAACAPACAAPAACAPTCAAPAACAPTCAAPAGCYR